MYHLILLLPRLLTNKHLMGWFKGSNLLLTSSNLNTPMSRIDCMGSGYVSQTPHRACLLTDSPHYRISTKQFPRYLSNYPYKRDKGVDSISPMQIQVQTHISWKSRRTAFVALTTCLSVKGGKKDLSMIGRSLKWRLIGLLYEAPARHLLCPLPMIW